MNLPNVCARILLTPFLFLAATAKPAEWLATDDGVTAYFGVVPSALVSSELRETHGAPARDAHGRPPATAVTHHFLVALFDAHSGARIESASVQATHTTEGAVTETKTLQAMRVGDVTTYGNFFSLDSSRRHDFIVTATLPGHAQAVRLHFHYGPEEKRP